MTTSARVLRLLALLPARRSWSARELADRLEITERTVRRDMARLRCLGYPVTSSAGAAGGYALAADAGLAPLRLEDDEGIAISVALAIAGGSPVAGLEEPLLRAGTKLDALLRQPLRSRLRDLRAAMVRLGERGPAVSLGVVTALAEACTTRSVVAFAYHDRPGRATTRSVEPDRLVHLDRWWYLAAWDRGRAAWRTFRIDRITAPVTLGARFVPRPPPEDDVGDYVTRAVSTGPYPCHAELVIDAPFARLRPKISPSEGLLVALGRTRCRLTTGSSSYAVMAGWLAQLDEPFEVVDPPELRRELTRLAARVAAAACTPRTDPVRGTMHVRRHATRSRTRGR